MKTLLAILLFFVSTAVFSQEVPLKDVTPDKVIEFYFPGQDFKSCEEGYKILTDDAKNEIKMAFQMQDFYMENDRLELLFLEHANKCDKCAKLLESGLVTVDDPPAPLEEGPEPEEVPGNALPAQQEGRDKVEGGNPPMGGPLDAIWEKLETRFNQSDKVLEGILRDQSALKALLEGFPREIIDRLNQVDEGFEGRLNSLRDSVSGVLDKLVKDREESKKEFQSLKDLVEKIKPFDPKEMEGLRDRIGNLLEEIQLNRKEVEAYKGLLSNLGDRFDKLREQNETSFTEMEAKFQPLVTLTERLETSVSNLGKAFAKLAGWLLLGVVLLCASGLIILAVMGAVYTSLSKKISGVVGG